MKLAFNISKSVLPVVSKTGEKVGFPVRRVYCIGQNYAQHAAEMGALPSTVNPFFFCKPADSIVMDKDNFSSASCSLSIHYPTVTECYHYEVELVVALGPASDGRDKIHCVSKEEASAFVFGYGIGFDMTRRDMQLQAKRNGKPWDLSKGPDDGVVVTPLIRSADMFADHPKLFTNEEKDVLPVMCNGGLYLKVNENERQNGNVRCMLSTIDDVIAILSKYVTLEPGDLIFTGTPAGVGPVRKGDTIKAGIEGVGDVTILVK